MTSTPSPRRSVLHRVPVGLVITLALATTGVARADSIDLTVENVKSTQGPLMIAVYGNAGDYRKKALREMKVPAVTPATTIAVADLPPGDYAIALFHDRNGNEKVDSNLFGVPTEPYGFSNNPKNLMSPATWDQSRFNVAGGGAKVSIRLTD